MVAILENKTLLEEYDFYCKRLDKAMHYNDTVKAIEEDSKEYIALVNIINECARLEGEIKGI